MVEIELQSKSKLFHLDVEIVPRLSDAGLPCHEYTTQGNQSPYLWHFLPFYCVFMAEETSVINIIQIILILILILIIFIILILCRVSV